MKYLLDTTIISEPLKPRPKPTILERLSEDGPDCAICAPVWHELRFGCLRIEPGKRRKRIEDFLHDVVRPLFRILPYDEAAAVWHAGERARLQRVGKPTAFADGQIAAIAATNDLTLVTHNVKHFRPFKGLTIETW